MPVSSNALLDWLASELLDLGVLLTVAEEVVNDLILQVFHRFIVLLGQLVPDDVVAVGGHQLVDPSRINTLALAPIPARVRSRRSQPLLLLLLELCQLFIQGSLLRLSHLL